MNAEMRERIRQRLLTAAAAAVRPGETTESPTVRITIPEGYTVAQIFNKLEENGVCSAESLFEVCNSFDYSYYSLVAEIPENEHRCFKLEGYLFPDTYDFYRDSKPEERSAYSFAIRKRDQR